MSVGTYREKHTQDMYVELDCLDPDSAEVLQGISNGIIKPERALKCSPPNHPPPLPYEHCPKAMQWIKMKHRQ